jgi:pyruvoyl-dependent arginine decarboxylase (PvlArgDC)
MPQSNCQVPARLFRVKSVSRSTANGEGLTMRTAKYVYWQDDDAWLGFLEEYPDYWTQGETLDDLIEHLKDLYLDVTSGQIPGIRRVGELTVT